MHRTTQLALATASVIALSLSFAAPALAGGVCQLNPDRFGNSATGNVAVACGYDNTARGVQSTAYGLGNEALGRNASAFGFGNEARDT